jgi:hypothetical protein
MADNVIRVNVTTVAPKSISIQGSREQNYINATGDTSGYNAQLAKNWAIGEGKIQGIDYSSKHYAGVAKEKAELSSESLNNVQEIVSGFGEAVGNATNELAQVKNDAIVEISNLNTSVIEGVETASNEAIAEIEVAKNNAVDNLLVKKNEIIAGLETVRAENLKELDAKGTELVANVTNISNTSITELEEKATNVTNTVSTSLQEYTEISEQIKADNSESSTLARKWAISDEIVEGIDYSAKYWADKAKDNSGIYYDEVGEETIDVDILEAGYVTTGALEETIGDISSVLDDILGDV